MSVDYKDFTRLTRSRLASIRSIKESASGMRCRDTTRGCCDTRIRGLSTVSQFAALIMRGAELQSGDWIMQRCRASCASQAAKPSHGIKPVTMLTKQYTYR